MSWQRLTLEVWHVAVNRTKAAQVRTRKFRSSDLKRAVRPDVVFNTIANLPRWRNGQNV